MVSVSYHWFPPLTTPMTIRGEIISRLDKTSLNSFLPGDTEIKEHNLMRTLFTCRRIAGGGVKLVGGGGEVSA